MLKCLTLERILKYLDHFNHSLFYLPFKAARKLVISIKAQVCFLDLLISLNYVICWHLPNWSLTCQLNFPTIFVDVLYWLLAFGFMCTSESWEKGRGNCCESWIVAGHFCPFSTLFCRDLFFPQKLPPPRLLVAQGCAANQQTIKYRRRKCGAGSFEVGPIWRFCNLFL